MKFVALQLSAVIIAVSSVTIIPDVLKDNSKYMVTVKRKAITECSQKYKISRGSLKDIINHVQVSHDKDTKCWLSCLMTKFGMIKNGKMDWEYFREFCKLGIPNEEERVIVDMVADICPDKVHHQEKNDCELAYSTAVCIFKYKNELSSLYGNATAKC